MGMYESLNYARNVTYPSFLTLVERLGALWARLRRVLIEHLKKSALSPTLLYNVVLLDGYETQRRPIVEAITRSLEILYF